MLWLLSPFNFLRSVSSTALVHPPTHHFCNIISHSKSRTTPLFPLIFSHPSLLISSSCHQLSLAERWPELHLELCLYSGECQNCTGKRSTAFEILFRTDCFFCKSLYMDKILPCSSARKQNYLWKAEGYLTWETPQKTAFSERLWGWFLTCAL